MTLLLTFIQKAIGQGVAILFGASGEIVTEKSGNLNLGIHRGAGFTAVFPDRICPGRADLQFSDDHTQSEPECGGTCTYDIWCWIR